MKKLYFLSISVMLLIVSQNGSAQTAPSWEWVGQEGGTSTDNVSSTATDSQGNVYVTGTYYSDTMILGNQTITNTGSGGEYPTRDIYIVKYNSVGNVLWAKNIGTPLQEDAYTIKTDNQDNFYIGGAFESATISFDNISLVNTGSGNDLFLAKYDSNGNAVWAKSAAGTEYDTIKSLTTDASGNIYAVGTFNSPTVDFGNNVIATIAPGTTDADVFVVKFNNEGIAQWINYAGGNSYDDVTDIALDAQGNSYITGFFYSSQITFGNTTLTNTNEYGDIFIVKLSNEGTVTWAKKEGGDNYDVANAIVLDTNGHLYIGGYYQSTSLTIGSTALNNSGSYFDLLIAKYNTADGTAIWAKTASGPRSDVIRSMAIDTQGSVYATGFFGGFGSGASTVAFPGLSTITSSGGGDIFLVKYNTEGTVQWLKTAGGTEMDYGVSVVMNSQNQIYTVGTIGSPLVNFDSNQVFTSGYEDLYIAKISLGILDAPKFERNHLTVYPNPAKNNIHITGAVSGSKYSITDTLGRNVQTGTITESTIDISSLPSGLYILTGNNNVTTKFIKE